MRRLAPLLALLLCACGEAEPPAMEGNVEAGRRLIAAMDCGVCHAIPGVAGARGMVGPPLAGFAGRAYIAGSLPNRPSVLVEWVRRAPELAPGTAMPRFPFSEREAGDVAAYLYTLR